jgi:hypothetical protein
MYIIRDRFGNKFPWSKKGKNRECEVTGSLCVTRKCFKPEDCGTVDPKTQKKNVVGKCKTLHEKGCPPDYNAPENFVTFNGKNEKRY